MDYPRFTTDQAAAVAGVPVNTVATWCKRGMISTYPGGSDVPPDVITPGTGRGRLFTRRSILHFVIVARLTRAGLGVELASRCASEFLDFGAMSGDVATHRSPGGFLPDGTAVLVVHVQGECATSRIVSRDQAKNEVIIELSRGNPILMLDLEAVVHVADQGMKKL